MTIVAFANPLRFSLAAAGLALLAPLAVSCGGASEPRSDAALTQQDPSFDLTGPPRGDPGPDEARAERASRRSGPARQRQAKAKARKARTKARAEARAAAYERLVLRPGESTGEVRKLQVALARLGYWGADPDGTYGALTEQAVLAFQGAENLQRDGVAGPQTLGALRKASRPSPRSEGGDLIEIDEDAGLLLVVRDGAVAWTFHTSTGTDTAYAHPSGSTATADTPDGRWTIAWAFDGWREGPLGELWRPRYFHSDGVAIHGFGSVPAYPASHGCARVSIPAMNFIWEHDLAPLGSSVWVY